MSIHSKLDKKHKTLYFNRFGLLQAFGSIFSIAGNYFSFEYEQDSFLSDANAIKGDWYIIGQDVQAAMKSYNYNSPQSIHKHYVNGRKLALSSK